MEPDRFQRAWQAHSSETRVTIATDLLRTEVQRSDRNFRAIIFWRDFREVGVALVLLPAWIYMGVALSTPWTWYLTVPALLWVAGFMLVDRVLHPQTPSEPGQPLIHSLHVSLTQVEHQIWLLRNISWWYLLPFTISILAFFAHVTWLVSHNWQQALGQLGFLVGFLFAVYYFIYWLNQHAVRRQLEL